MALVERSHKIDIPAGYGLEPLLKIVRDLLGHRNILSISVRVGAVEYTMLAEAEDESGALPTSIDLDTVSPYTVVRSNALFSAIVREETLLSTLLSAIQHVSSRKLWPVGWLTSPTSLFWRQIQTEYYLDNQEDLLGFPVYLDPQLDDDVVVLAAARTRGAEPSAAVEAYVIKVFE